MKIKFEKIMVGLAIFIFISAMAYDYMFCTESVKENDSQTNTNINVSVSKKFDEENVINGESEDREDDIYRGEEICEEGTSAKKAKINKKRNKSEGNLENKKKINLNTASVSEIAANLKGIGEKKAKLIVLYRKSRGNFASIDEVKNIKGIGEKIFEKIKDKIIV